MEHQPYTLCADTFNMRLCCSARCPHKKRHRAAINHLVGIRPRLYDKRLLAKKLWFQLQRPLFPARAGRMAYTYHLVGYPLFFLLLRRSKLRSTCRHVRCSLCHLRLLCGVQMATHLLPLHRRRGTLRNGYFGNPCSYGSHHGRNVNDNRHCQKLESVIGRYIHIYQCFRVFQLHQYRKRKPIHPQNALLFPSVRRRLLSGACRKPAKDERIDGKETVRLRHWTLQGRQLQFARADALPSRLLASQRMGGNGNCGTDTLPFHTRYSLCLVLLDTHV